jgi:hypothetical protein
MAASETNAADLRADSLLMVPECPRTLSVIRLEPSAGIGILLKEGESCQLDSTTGAVIITLEGKHIGADPCGISHPNWVIGQQWPSFESD